MCHEKLTCDDFYKRVRAVQEELLKDVTIHPMCCQPTEIQWMLACARIGEKHPDVVKYGKMEL